jgi:biotin transport system substrate-specific component
LAGTALLALSAKIQVPFYPVPLTMQTYVLLVLGMAYGWRLGGATVLLYLAEGAVGLPVFAGTPAKGIGLAYMAGSTGGYLVGFVLAALLSGWLAERGWDRHLLPTAVAMTAGTALIFIPGLIWLGVLLGWDKPIVAWGLIPFLPGAVAKIALAMFTLPLAWRAVGRK